MRPKIIVGITGASGAIFGISILQALRALSVETHLVMSEWAEKTIRIETDFDPKKVVKLATRHYRADNLAAAISSGSFLTEGMIIAPCSMKTVGEIAGGLSGSLISRAADVQLKERRKLVLMVRESPLNSIHLENFLRLSHAGAVIAPTMPAFYTRPETVDDIVQQIVGRTLDQFDLRHPPTKRWPGVRG